MDFIVDGFWKQIVWWAYMMDLFDMISKSRRIIVGTQLEYFYLNLEICRIIYDAAISYEAN